MLSELRVENLGIIAELRVTLGAGLTVITGETGAGKTLDRRRARPADRRPRRSADGARRCDRGARRGSVRRRRRRGRAGARRPRGRSIARLRQRPAGDGGRARGVRAPARRPARSARAPVAARAGRATRAARPLRGTKAQTALAALRTARDGGTRVRRGAGGTRRRRAARAPARSICCATRSTRSTPRESPTRARTTGSSPESELLADAEAHREALATAYRELEGAGDDALGRRGGRARRDARRSSRWPSVCGCCRPSMQEAAHDVRTTEESIVADPQRLQVVQTAGAAARGVEAQVRTPASPTSSSMAAGTRQRLDELETPRRARRRARGVSTRCAGRGRNRPRARVVEGAPRGRARTRRRGDAASPRARVPGRDVHDRDRRRATSDADGDRRRRRRRRHVPARAEPGRAGPTAGQGGVGRRALAHDAGAASGAVGSAADARVRRGRRRHRR